MTVPLIVIGLLNVAFLLFYSLQEDRHRDERKELYQRIQAPQQVVNEVIAQSVSDPQETYIPIHDDQAFQTYKADRN